MNKTSSSSKSSDFKSLFKNPIVILSMTISVLSLFCAVVFWWKWQVAINNEPGKFDRPLTIEEQRQVLAGLSSSTSSLIADKKAHDALTSLSSTNTDGFIDQGQQLELLKKLKR
jgi:hypothetical protein